MTEKDPAKHLRRMQAAAEKLPPIWPYDPGERKPLCAYCAERRAIGFKKLADGNVPICGQCSDREMDAAERQLDGQA